MYDVIFTTDAQKDVKILSKKAPLAIPKLKKLTRELEEHPHTGTGQIEKLKHYKEETWSRRITHEHRLCYRINEEEQTVSVISAWGHY